MTTKQKNRKIAFCVFIGTAVSIFFFQSPAVLAQEGDSLALEEIIVTAQRREQSMQEVPVALEVFSGAEIRKQGFRDIDALANFSPTVLIDDRVQDQDISIRGFGTSGNALTLDQAAPTFVDGIHFGRSSQIRLAFMDLESVEILKGPQPVAFGQNAIAGAFNIRSRRPTDTWQSNLDLEFGNNATQALDFGIGGPLTDTLGIRVAGKYDSTEGYLTDIISQNKLGAFENIGGRVILEFKPTERFTAAVKFEASRIRKDGEVTSICKTDGPLLFGRDGPTDPGAPGDERSVFADPPLGSGFSQAFTPLKTNCFDNNQGISNGGPFFAPPANIREENSNSGSLDIRSAAEGFTRGDRNKSIIGYEDIDANNGYVDLVYNFDNGIQAQLLSGWSFYDRDYVLDNSNSPFLFNLQGRGEFFDQYSSELRIMSATGGRIEWTVGGSWQDTELFAWSSSLRANVRQSQRYNEITEDVTYKTVFANVTFNFLGDKLSLDIGGRYSDIEKNATVEGYAASWVFAVCPEDPCDAGLTPVNVVFDPVLDGYAGCEGLMRGDRDVYCLVDPASARLFVDVPAGTLLYAVPFRETRTVPDLWSGASPVGLTAKDFAIRVDRGEGPYDENFNSTEFDPQISLRYRATENLSFYTKYAEAFKIGGFDTGQTSIPRSLDELTFGSETAENWEAGVKGTAWNGRIRFDVDVFKLRVPDLQTTATAVDPEQTSESVNAGQRVTGWEFNTEVAATENLRLGLAGAFMDGVITKLEGVGCTDAELFTPDSGCTLLVPGEPIEGGFIDRSGSTAPRTPEWKFVGSVDYQMPVAGKYTLSFSAKGYYSDGYLLDVEGFDSTVKFNRHGDLNLLIGFGDIDGRWIVSLFGRSLFEASPTYNAKFDVIPNGLASRHLGPSAFTTYGVKFQYFMN